MNTTENQNSPAVNNLVMFPASKNFPEIGGDQPLEDDPLEDLLRDCEEDYEDVELLCANPPSLSGANLAHNALDHFVLIQSQMSVLEDSLNRIRIYMDEIETRLS